MLVSNPAGIAHAESHALVSHSDTTGTGAELNTLTDGSETTLHSHAGGGDVGIQFVPAAIQVASGDYVLFVPLFKDTTGTPDRCVVVTVLSTSTIAVIEYKLLGGAWVFDPADCARDNSVTLNFTANLQNVITAFAIDSPVSTSDRIVFIVGNNNDTTDTFEMDSIVLTPGGTSLTATAVVIAGTNQPTDTNSIGTIGIPLSLTRLMTFFEDDAHLADITESSGTYTMTYDDSKVLAVDTSIDVDSTKAPGFSGIVIGSQLLLMRAAGGGGAIASDRAWEMSTSAVLTEEFNPFRSGLMGTDQSVVGRGAPQLSAIGGAFATASQVGGDGLAGQVGAFIVSTFPLDEI